MIRRVTSFANAEALGNDKPNPPNGEHHVLPPLHPPRNFHLLHHAHNATIRFHPHKNKKKKSVNLFITLLNEND